MEKVDILEKHFPYIDKMLENAKYNSEQDITTYFGKTIMVLYSGHGGHGWNYRVLDGEYDDRYFVLVRDQNGRRERSLLSKDDWYCHVILPEKIEEMEEYFPNHPNLPTPTQNY